MVSLPKGLLHRDNDFMRLHPPAIAGLMPSAVIRIGHCFDRSQSLLARGRTLSALTSRGVENMQEKLFYEDEFEGVADDQRQRALVQGSGGISVSGA